MSLTLLQVAPAVPRTRLPPKTLAVQRCHKSYVGQRWCWCNVCATLDCVACIVWCVVQLESAYAIAHSCCPINATDCRRCVVHGCWYVLPVCHDGRAMLLAFCFGFVFFSVVCVCFACFQSPAPPYMRAGSYHLKQEIPAGVLAHVTKLAGRLRDRRAKGMSAALCTNSGVCGGWAYTHVWVPVPCSSCGSQPQPCLQRRTKRSA